MKLALIQTNPTIGDVPGNAARVLAGLKQAAEAGAQLAVFPEQSLIGYPAKDLLLRREIIDANLQALAAVAAAAQDCAAIVGFAERNPQARGRPLFNAAALVQRGRVLALWRKRLLPTYDVFDELRYFEPGGPTSATSSAETAAPVNAVVDFAGLRLGVTICEDMWSREEMPGQPRYDCDPVHDLVATGAQVILNISASPYFLGKHALRLELLAWHARTHGVPLLFANQVGGNDELLLDGASCAEIGRASCRERV